MIIGNCDHTDYASGRMPYLHGDRTQPSERTERHYTLLSLYEYFRVVCSDKHDN